MNGINTFLLSAQFRWLGHLVRMNDDRILKAVFYGQLYEREHNYREVKKRFKDS